MTCYICAPSDPNASSEGCADCEASYVNQVVIPAGVEVSVLNAPNDWTDFDKVYEGLTRPYRGGVLSDRGRHDPKVSRERLRKDAKALLWQLHWATRDIVNARSWGTGLAEQNQHYRDRITELFGLLTDEQKDVMRTRGEARRSDLKAGESTRAGGV